MIIINCINCDYNYSNQLCDFLIEYDNITDFHYNSKKYNKIILKFLKNIYPAIYEINDNEAFKIDLDYYRDNIASSNSAYRKRLLIIDKKFNINEFINKIKNLNEKIKYINNKIDKKIYYIYLKKINNLNELEELLSDFKDNGDNNLKIFIININLLYEFYDFKNEDNVNISDYPIKLIDVQIEKVINSFEINDAAYCCVSYSWSIYEHKQEQEVLKIMCKNARNLGFRYMWVDKYCINQKDDKEKAIEIPKMRNYYMNAQGTIVWLHDIEYINNDMKKSKWLTRLWTLQEWELSHTKWLLTCNGKYIKYNSNKHSNLFPNICIIG